MQQLVRIIRLPVLIFLIVGLASCDATKQTSDSGQANMPVLKPKNVIFLIGDGMGLPQITGAIYMRMEM